MGALVAFAVGYVVGSRQGQNGLQDTVKAWNTIRNSPEFQAFLASGASLAGNVIKQGIAQGRGPIASSVASSVASEITERAKDVLMKRTSMRVIVG